MRSYGELHWYSKLKSIHNSKMCTSKFFINEIILQKMKRAVNMQTLLAFLTMKDLVPSNIAIIVLRLELEWLLRVEILENTH